MKKEIVDNLIEEVQVQGRLVPLRRYWMTDHFEFRFPYKDPGTGERRFKCARTIGAAREAAKGLQEPVLTPAQAQAASMEAMVRKAIADALGHLTQAPSPPLVQQVTFADVADRFLADKQAAMERGELRPPSFKDLKTRTRHLKRVINGVHTSQLTVQLLDLALASLPSKSSRSIWNYRSTLRSVLIWARDRGQAPANIVQVIDAMTVKGNSSKDAEKINPFSTEEVTAVLEACLGHRSRETGAKLAATIALQAFCGMRGKEACVLDWANIDLQQGLIRLKANGSKVRRNRTIPIPSNCKGWLELVSQQVRRGRLFRWSYWDALAAVQERAAMALPGFAWRPNGLRQAFISHHLALHDSITETAYAAGNSPAKIKSNYWKLKTKEEAVKYFNIRPTRQNVDRVT